MKQYHLPVDWMAMNEVVLAVLREDFGSLKDDLSKVLATRKGYMFSLDPEEDAEKIIDLISAYKKVIHHYGG